MCGQPVAGPFFPTSARETSPGGKGLFPALQTEFLRSCRSLQFFLAVFGKRRVFRRTMDEHSGSAIFLSIVAFEGVTIEG
jgi:hypothetical protein